MADEEHPPTPELVIGSPEHTAAMKAWEERARLAPYVTGAADEPTNDPAAEPQPSKVPAPPIDGT